MVDDLLRVLRFAFVVVAGLLAPAASARAAQAVDLELVLAVDASASVNYDEFQLQMSGLAEAFRHPAVIAAIRSAAPNGVAVSLVQWSGVGQHVQAVGWTEVRDSASANVLAARIDAAPRLTIGGATALGNAIEFSLNLLETNAFRGARWTIDVSGDGTSNQGVSPIVARARAVTAGATVNGLAILNEEPNLDAYYLAAVIGGSGAFLLTADDYDDFARAIRLKLIAEITGAPYS